MTTSSVNRVLQANTRMSKLVAFLEKRDYSNPSNLTNSLKTANRDIERVVNQALDDTMAQLDRYIEEAYLWSENRMTNLDGTPEKITKREQRKAKTELKRLRKTKLAILSLRFQSPLDQ